MYTCPNCAGEMNATEIAPVAVMVGAYYSDSYEAFSEQVATVQMHQCGECGYVEGR